MSDVRKLFRRAQSLEKELTELAKDPLTNEEKMAQCRTKIAEKYEKIMLLDLEFAVSYDVAHLLWKAIYYRQIEHFRSKARKYQSSKKEKHQQRFKEMISSFCIFVNEGIKDLQVLSERIKKQHGGVVKSSMLVCTLTVSMGDLARYKAVYETGPGKGDWSVAKGLYRKAMLMDEGSGVAHNQMAVLASYEMDDFEAMYHHYRSLAAKKLFPSARENLINLFNRNNQKFVPDSGKKATGGNSIQDGMMHFKEAFVRIQGMIFTKIGCEAHDGALMQLMTNLATLLAVGKLEADFVGKLMLCNVFLVEHAAADQLPATATGEGQGRPVLMLAWRTAVQSFCQIVKGLTEHNAHPFLGALSIFLMWLQHSLTFPSLVGETQASLISHIAQLANLTNTILRKTPRHDGLSELLLEDHEIRGFVFIPIDAHQESLVPQESIEFVPPGHPYAVQERCCRIQRVVDWLVTEGLLVHSTATKQFEAAQLTECLARAAPPPTEDAKEDSKSTMRPSCLKLQLSTVSESASPLVSPQTYITNGSPDESDLDDFVDDGEQIIFQGIGTVAPPNTAPPAPTTTSAVQGQPETAHLFPAMVGMLAQPGPQLSNPSSFFTSPLFFTPQPPRPVPPNVPTDSHRGIAAVLPLPDGSTGRPQALGVPVTVPAPHNVVGAVPQPVHSEAVSKPFTIQHPFLPETPSGTFQPMTAPGIPLSSAAGPTMAHLQHPSGKYTCWPR
eukprot:GGOE01020424.1.p1 GENE.GGOE01020424.1~~GGOE01020424.1.p1  ORF type:complete len:726 (-),score=118.48 GGOE01020424.1:310-2487(-)